MHEGAAGGDVEGQNGTDLGLGILEQVAGSSLNGVGRGTLRDTDGQGVSGQVQHVAALDVGVEITVIVTGDEALEIGMIFEDVIRIDGLTAAGGETHLVQEHAGAHGSEGIAGEVQVGHGIHDQVISGGDHILQGVSGNLVAHLLQGDAFHGLLDQGLALEVAAQVVVQLVLPFLGLDVALRQPLIQEGLDQFGMQLQDVGHQVLEVNNLGAVVTQDLRKRVMLLLSNFQEGNIIKQQLWETVRGQVQKFFARAVKKYFLKGVDLTSNTDAFHGSTFLLI